MSSVPSIGAVCTLAFRAARPRSARTVAIGMKRAALTRGYADQSTNDPSKLPTAKDKVGPNMQQAEHVSEEAAKMAKITGSQGPDIDQGTPVQEILKEEPETKQNAPQVLKSESNASSGKRSFSTYVRKMQPSEMESGENMPGGLDLSMIPTSEQRTMYASSKSPLIPKPPTALIANDKPAGHKFPLPTLPLPERQRAKQREEPVVTQLTKLMMRDGKLARAQRWTAYILNALRSAPAPKYSDARPLLPNAPPAAHLPLDPVAYITLAIDSLAPLFRIRRIRGAAGGGNALELPSPLTTRQRRRTAITWILASVEKKQSKTGGQYAFPQKVADEIAAIVEGRSANWIKRDGLHRLSTVSRSNLTKVRGRKR